MKRSITPLHCGSPTKDGECRIPSHCNSAPNAWAVYCGPQSLREHECPITSKGSETGDY
jgi:hypothetical protein